MAEKDIESNKKKNADNTNPGLKEVLSMLMLEGDVDEATLSRETGVSDSTIFRMRTNSDANPTAANLRLIARYFGISIDQLLGDEPLPVNRIPGSHHPQGFTAARMPVIGWDQITGWIYKGGESFKEKLNNWISTEKEVGDKTFALIIPTDSFGLAFRKGSLIIIDPARQPQDGDIVLLLVPSQNNEIMLRHLVKDGNEFYIRSINPELKSIKPLTDEYTLLGVTIETRFSLQEEGVKATEKTRFATSFIPAYAKLQRT